MEEREEYKPIFSCSQAPSCCQVVSYCIITTLYVVFMAGLQPYLDTSARIALLVLIHLTLIFLVVSTLAVSLHDPVDPNVPKYRNQGQSAFTPSQLEILLWCDACRSYVDKSAKHCRVCNRCVADFDHHCMWVGNCIGKSNYKVFIVMMVSALVLMVLFIAATGQAWKGDWKVHEGGMIVAWITLCVVIPFLLLITILLIFHIHLIITNNTTYDFLVQRKERQLQEQLKKRSQGNPAIETRMQTTVEQLDNIELGVQGQPPTTQLTQSKAMKLIIGDSAASKPVDVKVSRLYQTMKHRLKGEANAAQSIYMSAKLQTAGHQD